jgi:L-iditol 2-dehydrogenase
LKEDFMLQAVLQMPEKVIFREIKRPVPASGQVLIKVERIGICGSDIHAYYGKHPYIKAPIVQGHEFSGLIAEVGERVEGLAPGDNVTVMPQLVCGQCYPCKHGNYHICNQLKVIGCQAEGAAQEYIAVNSKLVVRLPENMNYEEGAMVEPVAVGAHAVGRLGNVEGLNVLVLGAGPIGNLTAQVAKGLGAKSVMITDVSNYRLGVARECGIEHAVNTSSEELIQALDKAFSPDRADAILECVGVQETIGQAIRAARKGSDIIVVGVFAERPSVDIGLVQDKELRLIGTLMYREEDYRVAVDLIRAGRVNLKPLMSKHFPFKEYPQAYKFIERNRERTMKVFIDL